MLKIHNLVHRDDSLFIDFQLDDLEEDGKKIKTIAYSLLESIGVETDLEDLLEILEEVRQKAGVNLNQVVFVISFLDGKLQIGGTKA